MNIHLKSLAFVFIIALLTNVAQCQTPDDDEVDLHIPDYPHKIYSGIRSFIQVFWSLILSSNQKLCTTYFILLKLTKQLIH